MTDRIGERIRQNKAIADYKRRRAEQLKREAAKLELEADEIDRPSDAPGYTQYTSFRP